MPLTDLPARSHPDHSGIMATLLTRYVSGEIEDGPWSRFMALIDDTGLDRAERRALAAFYRDASDEFGPDQVYFPESFQRDAA